MTIPPYMNANDARFLDCAMVCFVQAMGEGKEHDSEYVKKQTYAMFLGEI